MRFIIINTNPCTGFRQTFYAKSYDVETDYDPALETVVIDTYKHLISFDGVSWNDIEKE